MAIIGWENSERIQFTIDTRGKNVEVIPFPFKISMTVGAESYNNTFIIDKLTVGNNSIANRKKVIFTQLYEGEEVPIFAELDTWDHSGRKALFWVKPKKYYNNNINIFYFYFDKTKEDNTLYLSETNIVPVSLFRNINTCAYDTLHTAVFDILKINNEYKLWLMGHNGTKWTILYTTSSDLINWSTPTLPFSGTHTYDAGGMSSGSVIYDNGTYKMWYGGYDGSAWHIMYCTSIDGIAWSDFQRVVTKNSSLYYMTTHTVCCSVLKVNNIYKMWYAGGNVTTYRIVYCESLDGITWNNHYLVVNNTDMPDSTTEIRPSTVLFKDDIYHMWIESYTSSKWVLYYTTSPNGINWYNIRRFVNHGIEGINDVSGSVFLNVLEDVGFYHMFFSGYSGSNWRIMYSKSVSLSGPRTPSQEVWADAFFSVHHLNVSYTYKDSTNSNLDVISTNKVSTTTSNLGGSSLTLTHSDSFINFGNSTAYDFSKTTGILMYGNFTSGNVFFSRDLYNDTSVSLIRYGSDYNLSAYSNSFTGQDYSQPNIGLWQRSSDLYLYGLGYILNNKLYLKHNTTPSSALPGYVSTFVLRGDFDIQVDFSNLSINASYGTSGAEVNLYTVSGTNYYHYIKAIPSNFMSDYQINSSWQGNQNVGFYNTYGAYRWVRNGTSLTLYYKAGAQASWTEWRTMTTSAFDLKVRCGMYIQTASTNILSFYYSNFIINSGTVIYRRGDISPNRMYLTTRDTSDKLYMCSVSDNNILNNLSTVFVGRIADSGANTLLYNTSSKELMGNNVDNLKITTTNFMVGYYSGSIIGELSEIWFTNKIFSTNTLDYVNKALRDEVIYFSRYYIQGYLTEYNKAVNKKLVAYSNSDNQLLGITYSKASDGYYYCEVPYNAEYYIVAFYGSKYNHYILSKIYPKQL